MTNETPCQLTWKTDAFHWCTQNWESVTHSMWSQPVYKNKYINNTKTGRTLNSVFSKKSETKLTTNKRLKRTLFLLRQIKTHRDFQGNPFFQLIDWQVNDDNDNENCLLILFQHKFCVHHTTMHQFTKSPFEATYVGWRCDLSPALLAEWSDLLHATVVTQGRNRCPNKSWHRKLTLEKIYFLLLLPGFEPETFRS